MPLMGRKGLQIKSPKAVWEMSMVVVLGLEITGKQHQVQGTMLPPKGVNMFQLSKLEHTLRLKPDLLSLPINEAVKGELEALFLDKVIDKLGLCISVYDIESIDGGFSNIYIPVLLMPDPSRSEPDLENKKKSCCSMKKMGRSSPNDKLLLVQALRKRGHVVAVTGDGTNDPPALHECRYLSCSLSCQNLLLEHLNGWPLNSCVVSPQTKNLMFTVLVSFYGSSSPCSSHGMDLALLRLWEQWLSRTGN